MAEVDETDWHLLGLLQEDARRGYRELARQAGLSPVTVANRVRRLENAGVISGYHARVDPTAAGYAVTAFIVVDTRGRRESLRVADLAKAHPFVLEDHRVTGSEDHVLKVVVPRLADLEPLIDQLNELGKPATTIVLSSPKPWSPIDSPQPMSNH
ncbi:Lrp/AsnC family transcriptional regulator [Microlunatus ginsengisoli]|uniref:Lrp/AsnC family transcriptional regulator n=1 Tax=Microlunatus ginsengisoli TaxID=363863 RepID=A0ABP7AZA9_9ACTN